jgi:outer membrane protein
MIGKDTGVAQGGRPLRARAQRGGRAFLLLVILGGLLPGVALGAPSLTRISIHRSGWFLGLGFLSYGWPYPEVTRWSRFVPIVDVEGDGFYVHGLDAGWWFYRTSRGVRLSLVLSPELLHLDPKYGPFARGLHDRLATLLGGLRGSLDHRDYALHLSALRDLLARSDGEVVRLSLGPRWSGEGWRLSSRFGIDWQSASQVDYYFGVSPTEATAARPVYRPGACVDADATLVVARRLGAHFEIVESVEEIWYGASIRESPLVDRATALSGLVGLMYRFR